MTTDAELLDHLWRNDINSNLPEEVVDNVIAACKEDPDGPFGDVGPAMQRMIDAGVSKRDIGLVSRFAAYEAVFGTLSALGEFEGEIPGLHESVLESDPSGLDGCPGSADAV